MHRKGFAPILVLMIIVLVGGGYFVYKQKMQSQQLQISSFTQGIIQNSATNAARNGDTLWQRYSDMYVNVQNKSPLKILTIVDLKNFSENKLYLNDYTGIGIGDTTSDGFLLDAINARISETILDFQLSERKIVPLALTTAEPNFPMFVDKTQQFLFYCAESSNHVSTYHLFDFSTLKDSAVTSKEKYVCGAGTFYSQAKNEIALIYCGPGMNHNCDYGIVDTTTKEYRSTSSPPKEVNQNDISFPAYVTSYVKSKNLYVERNGIYKNSYQVGTIYYSVDAGGAVISTNQDIVFVSSDSKVRTIETLPSGSSPQVKLVGGYLVYSPD